MAATEGFFKVIIIGDYSVGKSSIMNKLCFDKFSDKYNVTVGVEFESKEIDVDGESVQFQIWDTAGQDKFKSMVRVFFSGVIGVFVAYAVNSRSSFENAAMWLNEARDRASPDALYVLVGNKNDIDREVSYEEGMEYMRKENLDLFFETSAKTGFNVQKVFFEAAKQILQRRKQMGDINSPFTREPAISKISLPEISLSNQQPETKKKGGCC